jgi:hypothetical protein
MNALGIVQQTHQTGSKAGFVNLSLIWTCVERLALYTEKTDVASTTLLTPSSATTVANSMTVTPIMVVTRAIQQTSVCHARQ